MPIVVAVLAGSEHEPGPAVSLSVTVTVGPAVVAPLALQFVKPAPRVIVGVPVTVNDELKTAVIVEPPTSAPFALDVNPTVHGVTEAADCVAPANETDVGAAAATIDGAGEAGTAVVSAAVLMLIVCAPVVVVFVIPSISNVAAVFFASAHVCPEAFASVIVTVVVRVAAVAVHVVAKLDGVRGTTVGVAGMVPP